MTSHDLHKNIVERAIFGSSDHGAIKGYQLLGWSPGIDSHTCKELSQWAPSRMQQGHAASGTLERDTVSRSTVHAFQISGNRVCVGRTFTAGQEYSGRGGSNIVSSYVILKSWQWQAYQYDTVAIFQSAMALGYMRQPFQFVSGQLEQVPFPLAAPVDSEAYYRTGDRSSQTDCVVDELPMDDIIAGIQRGKRVILLGLDQPLLVMAHLIQQLEHSSRQNLSFTTGLPLSIHRPFQVHCLDPGTYRQQMALAGWLADMIVDAPALAVGE